MRDMRPVGHSARIRRLAAVVLLGMAWATFGVSPDAEAQSSSSAPFFQPGDPVFRSGHERAEEALLRRSERRNDPVLRAERRASRDAFKDLDRSGAWSLAKRKFPDFVGRSDGSPLRLSSGLRAVEPLDETTVRLRDRDRKSGRHSRLEHSGGDTSRWPPRDGRSELRRRARNAELSPAGDRRALSASGERRRRARRRRRLLPSGGDDRGRLGRRDHRAVLPRRASRGYRLCARAQAPRRRGVLAAPVPGKSRVGRAGVRPAARRTAAAGRRRSRRRRGRGHRARLQRLPRSPRRWRSTRTVRRSP